MPRSLYKAISQGFTPYDSAPVFARRSSGAIVQDNRQIKKHYLCKQCEDLFNKNGERLVTSECRRSRISFRLRDKLRNSRPTGASDGQDYYIPKDVAKSIDCKAYKYFAYSILWRLVSTRWSDVDMDQFYGKLLAPQEEGLRMYLLGGKEPEDAYLTVIVDSDVNELPILSFPTGDLLEDGACSFYIPGVKFCLNIGVKVDPNVASGFSSMETNHVFCFRSFRQSPDFQQAVCMVTELEPKGRLVKPRPKGRGFIHKVEA